MTSGPVTRTFFPGHYEEEVTGGITTTIKHYSFNGQIIATRRGTTLSYLHTDHLSSNNLATSSSGTQTASRTYYAYGTEQPGGTGTLPTDRTFTGQKADSTGLMYFNARYYDSYLNQFKTARLSAAQTLQSWPSRSHHCLGTWCYNLGNERVHGDSYP